MWRIEERVRLDKGRVRGEGLHVERLSPRTGERYGEDGADPGWAGLVVVVAVVVVVLEVDSGEGGESDV